MRAMWRSIPALLTLTALLVASGCSSSGTPRGGPRACEPHWIEVPAGVEPGKPLSRPNLPTPRVGPDYGYACVEVTVTTEGEVVDPEVLATNSDPFAASFLQALTRWRYEPSTRDGEPVELRIVVSASYHRPR